MDKTTYRGVHIVFADPVTNREKTEKLYKEYIDRRFLAPILLVPHPDDPEQFNFDLEPGFTPEYKKGRFDKISVPLNDCMGTIWGWNINRTKWNTTKDTWLPQIKEYWYDDVFVHEDKGEPYLDI